MPDFYTHRRKDQAASRDADQAEFAAMRLGTAPAEAGVTDDRISGTMAEMSEEAPVTGAMRWQKDDAAAERVIGKVQEEIERRAGILGDAYPFEMSDGVLRYKRSDLGFYEFCLAACMAETITAGDFVHLPRDFERFVALVVRAYMGPHSFVLHVGAPREKEVGSGFYDAMLKLHEVSGEWRWNPEEGLPDEHRMSGDEGVDFIVWKSPLDQRPGQIFLLGQCACGDDWEDKFHDLDLKRFGKWFRQDVFPEPIRVFATPHHVTNQMLREAHREAGLVLDRARLVLIASHLTSDADIVAWKDRLARRRALVAPSIAA